MAFGQNFLHRRETARKIVRVADPAPGTLCVDLGAGGGIITEACLAEEHRVRAVEVDDRLAAGLRRKFCAENRVEVVHTDLLAARLPAEPYVITANPPFNQSTMLVRRWILTDEFVAAAIVVQKEFGRKLAGSYGATKISLALAPFMSVSVPVTLHPSDFQPQPRVPIGILQVNRHARFDLDWSDRRLYWLFINYLFERSHPAVADALRPLRLRKLPVRLRNATVRNIESPEAVELFDQVRARGPAAIDALAAFDRNLPAKRRLNLGPNPV